MEHDQVECDRQPTGDCLFVILCVCQHARQTKVSLSLSSPE